MGKLLKEFRKIFPHGHPDFYELIFKICDTHNRKNADYSKEGDPLSNLRISEEIGIPAWKGSIIRMGDKWCRITQLALKGEALVKDESIIDTLEDLAVYSLLTIILYKEGKNVKEKSKS